ncbi:MAG: hypothetical protein FJ272_04665 [Planctomycetes bacterium]|nr:hypothetical protein [Planctomycetota bacterium]
MYSALWMFAWDLQDEGVEKVLGFAADCGLSAVQIASSYHAGNFILGHNPKRVAYFPEDGVAYFHPHLELYAGTKLKPKIAEVSRRTDWFAEAGQRLDRFGLKLVAWTVCCHNTRLGLLHPDCVSRNVFGDPYYHALCPSNDDVRAYVVALVKDLAANYPMYAVQLESPEFMGLVHGHHHERQGVVLDPLSVSLLSLCFCEACLRKAGERGIDAQKLRATLREHLRAVLDRAPFYPLDRPGDMAGLLAACPELGRFAEFREQIALSLLKEIRDGMGGTKSKLFLLGGPSERRIGLVDAFEIGIYGKKPFEAEGIVSKAARAIRGRVELHAGIRVGFNSISGPGDLTDTVRSVKDADGDGVLFYNYSEAPLEALRWIKTALAGV